MNFLKKLFGLDNDQQNSSQWRPNHHDNNRDSFLSHQDNFSGTIEDPFSNFQGDTFDMFTSPLDMHRYFEQQMNEMLKTFGFSSNGMPSFGGFFSQHGMPALEDGRDHPFHDNEPDTHTSNLRDHFLKKGYEHPQSRPVDKDVDKEFNIGDLGSILGRQDSFTQTPSNTPQIPLEQPQIHSSIFGQSVSIKTIRNPDGSQESHKTIRNSDGSEETQITRRLGEKEYTIIKKRDKNGQEEVIENMLNMDENEKQGFLAPKQHLPQIRDGSIRNNSFWDKFFK